jgi:hypothetical protein
MFTIPANKRYGIMAPLGQTEWPGHTSITGHQNSMADQKKKACSA